MNLFNSMLSFFKEKPMVPLNIFIIDDMGNKWEFYSNGNMICNDGTIYVPAFRKERKKVLDKIKEIMDKPIVRNKKIDDILNGLDGLD